MANGARLAAVAAARGDAARAGRLWGAVEGAQEARPVPGWTRLQASYGERVLRADGGVFARARAEGRLLSIARAALRDGEPAVTSAGSR